MAGPIVVSIVGDNRRLASSVDSSRSQLGKLGGFAKTAGLGVAAGLAVAGAAAVKFGIDSVKAASDSQQSMGATRTVFGKYADEVIKRSNDSAKAIGVSANEYRELSNVVGASLSGAGVPLAKAADLTDKLNVRAADLAATFGGSTKDAVQAFSSLLRGEADPIERYGISVKQSDVNARLAAQGLDGLTGSALKQAEMQARLDLAFQQSGKSAGAFGRESDTLANRQQILGAMWDDLQAKAGQVLLPVLTRLGTFAITTLVPALEKIGPPVLAFAKAAGNTLAPIITRVVGIVAGNLIPAVRNAAERFQDMRPTIGRITDAVGVLAPILARVAGFIAGQLVNAISTGIPVVAKIAATILETGVAATKAVAGFVNFLAGVRDKIGAAMDFVRGVPDKIRGAFGDAGSMLTGIGQDIGRGLVAGLEAAKDWVINKIQEIADVIPGWVKKRLGIASPSKVMAQIGQWTVQGMAKGLADGAPGVLAVVSGLTDKLESQWKKLDSGKLKKRMPGVMAAIKSEVTELKTKANEYEALAKRLQAARDKAAGVSSSALDYASIAGLGERTITGRNETTGEDITTIVGPTSATITEDLQAKLQALQDFTAKVDALRQAGLNQTTVDQIIAEGVEKGSLTASALVAGGPQAIAAVNGIQSQITAAAGQLGQVAAVNMYGTGAQAAAGFITGLESDLAGIEKSANKIARALVRAIRKELKIKSPSRVSRDLARNFTDGIVIQTQRDAGRVSIAGKATARAMIDGFGEPTARAQLSQEALDLASTRGQATVAVHLTADQLDALQRGQRLSSDLREYAKAGGKVNLT
jgi:uncharacterized membrane-anchored protein YhcB (DUF1043 family)